MICLRKYISLIVKYLYNVEKEAVGADSYKI